jgi:hypothetical protein
MFLILPQVDMINLKVWCKMDKNKELITPRYVRKSIDTYQAKTQEFRKRVLPDEFEKLLVYWKELIALRKQG